jgi:hypothetical protein
VSGRSSQEVYRALLRTAVDYQKVLLALFIDMACASKQQTGDRVLYRFRLGASAGMAELGYVLRPQLML